MSRYDGLIIPRSYNDYFSRSDPAAARALAATMTESTYNPTGTLPVNGTAVNNALANYQKKGEYIIKLPPTTETTYLRCPVFNIWNEGLVDWYLRSNKDNQIWSLKITSWFSTSSNSYVPAVVIRSSISRGINITEIKGLYNSYWGGCQIAIAIPPHSEEIEIAEDTENTTNLYSAEETIKATTEITGFSFYEIAVTKTVKSFMPSRPAWMPALWVNTVSPTIGLFSGMRMPEMLATYEQTWESAFSSTVCSTFR